MAKYGAKAQRLIEDTLDKYEDGTLKSGKSARKVTNRKQAIAIGISEARSKGYEVPSEGK